MLKKLYVFLILNSVFNFNLAQAQNCADAFYIVADVKINPIKELQWYETLKAIKQKPTRDIRNFAPKQGIFVTKRDQNGQPVEAFIRVLSDNPNNKIEVIGDFNNWGKSGTVVLQKDSDPIYYSGAIRGIKHGHQYRLLLNGQQLVDPSALVQTTPQYNEKMYGKSQRHLNSVFWDIEGEGKYQHKNKITDLRFSAMSISEVEMHGLVARWPSGNQVGPDKVANTYNFVADSGIIQHLKSRGINAVEFLPFNAAADGDRWAFRYQVFGPFAIESKYGTPAEFARMVDKFNEAGIAVIMDVLLSHYPYDSNLGERNLKKLGKHNFKKSNGRALYGDEPTQWGTYRYDYENPYVRRFLIDSILNTVKYFRIGGIRIDNYDGIRFRPGGTEFLKQLAFELRQYAPELWINAEMFTPENSVTKRHDWGGHGMNTYNNGNFFWNVIRTFAQKRTEEIDMNIVKNTIREIWRWNEAMKLYYATNHDEAANFLEGATGAYFATLVNGGGWNYVEGKTRAFGALTMLASSYYLDMPQLRILQEGTFTKNPDVEWDLLKHPSQRHSDRFFGDISNYFIKQAAFAPHNMHPNIENHTDQNNKIISLERIDFSTGKRIYIVVNLGHNSFHDYAIGVSKGGEYHVAIDSDDQRYGGTNTMARKLPKGRLHSSGYGAHGKAYSLTVPFIGPFGVVIFEH